MKAINYLFFFFIILNISCTHRPQISHRENGWYHYENDSLSSEPIVTVKEFTGLKLDSDMHGTYVILGKISKHKTEKWADETEKSTSSEDVNKTKSNNITSGEENIMVMDNNTLD